MWVQLSTTCSNVLKQPNEKLLVAVSHNQLRTMASKAVDPIDWSHPPPSWAVPAERHVHSINQCNLGGTRTCNRSMRGNRLAYAATQGMYRPMSCLCGHSRYVIKQMEIRFGSFSHWAAHIIRNRWYISFSSFVLWVELWGLGLHTDKISSALC